MSEDKQSIEHWLHVSMLAIKIVSFALIIAAMLYLVVAGANFAVLGAIFFEEEYQATASMVAFALVLFALLLASGLLGIWAAGRRDRMSMLIFSAVSIVSVIAMIAGIATSYFSQYDSAFSDFIVSALSFTFIVFAAVAGAAGIAWAVLQHLEGAAPAAVEDGAAASVEAEEAPEPAAEDTEPAEGEEVPADEFEYEDSDTADAGLVEPLEAFEDDESDVTAVVNADELNAEIAEVEAIEAAKAEAEAEGPAEAEEPAAPVAREDNEDDAAGLTKLPLDFMALDDHVPGGSPFPHVENDHEAEPVASAPKPDPEPEPEPEPELPRPAGKRYAHGAVPVPRVARTARNLTVPEGATPAPAPQRPLTVPSPGQSDPSSYTGDVGEIEWVDFGAQSRVMDDIDEGQGGFLGKHFSRKR